MVNLVEVPLAAYGWMPIELLAQPWRWGGISSNGPKGTEEWGAKEHKPGVGVLGLNPGSATSFSVTLSGYCTSTPPFVI